MTNSEYDITELSKYIKKLTFYVSREATFNIGNIKILDKSRVDDLLCCIESSLPDAFKKHIRHVRNDRPKSQICYMQLISSVRKKFFLSSGHYIVKESEIISVTKAFLANIESDLRALKNS